MKNILNIILHDFKRLTASMVALVILMGIIVVPCLFAWLNILSNWDPFEPESTGRIPVAVATEDEGTEMLGMNINVGEKFIDVVNGNDMIGWDTSQGADDAVKGVQAGDYYAAVIIPSDFSKNMLSFASGQIERPKILFYENEKTNAIAPKITGKVRTVLEDEVGKAFVDTLGRYITEAANAAKANGLDPQVAFGDISNAMNDLSTNLDSSVSVLRSAAGLSEAAGSLLNATNDLIDSSEGTLELGEQILESLGERVPEKVDVPSVEKVLGNINSLLETDLEEIENDFRPVRNNIQKFNQFVEKKLERRKRAVTRMKSSTDKIAKKLEGMKLTGLSSRFSHISGKLGSIIEKINKLETAKESNWADMKSIVGEILSDTDAAKESLEGIASDVDSKLDKKLNEAVADARNSIAKTSSSLSGIYGDMTTLGDALSKSDSSLKSLEKGLSETASTLISLQSGSKNLAKLFDNFANSEILSDVNHLMTNDAAVIAENMASPIKMKTEKIFPVDHFGGVMAPFYNVIAQWIGALFAAVMLRVHVKRREELGQIKLHEAFFGRYRLFMMIGLAQALLLSIGELLYVGIQCLHPFLFILASCVNSIVFTLMIYSFVFALENMGLAVSVILMIVQVAGGGGTFPVEVLPPVFKAIYAFMPFPYAMDAMRECIGGMYGNTYVRCLGILLLFGLGAVIFGLLLHKPMRGMIEKVEASKEESDVML